MSASIWIVTPARGRHAHLHNQLRFLAHTDPHSHHVIVAMGDPELRSRAAADAGSRRVDVCEIEVSADGSLPLAAARNLGVGHALSQGADLIVLLDVDCILLPGALDAYRAAALDYRDALLSGAVTYLPEGTTLPEDPRGLTGLLAPHPARPAPPRGEVIPHGNLDLFWSLNGAFTPEVWRAIGGFCEDYTGYGGEDTDFGRLAGTAGIDLAWVGGADALHQWHPVSSPPVEHLDAIIGNAHLFKQRWGVWPMTGWLQAFADAGLVTFGEEHLAKKSDPGTT